jgi:prepilin-type N-terminal cleavage/methylation domain-containing protein
MLLPELILCGRMADRAHGASRLIVQGKGAAVMVETRQALDRALGLVGRLDEAEVLYRQILAREPEHAESLHLLGVNNTPARPPLLRRVAGKRGFTLIEALVALAVILAFAAVLGPYMFHARRIASGIDGRIAAQILLRSLLDSAFDRSNPVSGAREGETAGLSWRVTAEPIAVDSGQPPRQGTSLAQNKNNDAPQQPAWTAFRVTAVVSWGAGASVSAETVRLGRTE